MSLLQREQHKQHIEKDGKTTFRVLYLPISPDKFKFPHDLVYPSYLYVEMCDNCGYIEVAKCEHNIETDAEYPVSACFWNDEGTILTCAVCGVDAT